jgi:myo-inositol 2-dehydrogenase/D-chiro-inositol 1-dehydrogenase
MVAGRQPKDQKSHETVDQRYRPEASGRNHNQPGDPDFAGFCGYNRGELDSLQRTYLTEQVRLGRATRHAHSGQHDPQQVLIETVSGVLADVEIFVNAQFGYQVATQAVFEKGIVNIGEDNAPYVRSGGRWGGEITPSFIERFRSAYDSEVQSWVDAAKRGEVGGPTAWDGYCTAACCEADVAAQRSGEKVKVSLETRPDIYR